MKQQFEDSGYKIDEVAGNLEAFKFTLNKLLNAPLPKQEAPPKEEKKADPIDDKQADVEMKDEVPK